MHTPSTLLLVIATSALIGLAMGWLIASKMPCRWDHTYFVKETEFSEGALVKTVEQCKHCGKTRDVQY